MLIDYEYAHRYGKSIRPGVVLNIGFKIYALEYHPDWTDSPKFDTILLDGRTVYRDWYGVCDDLDNLFAVYPELLESDRQFVVSMTCIDPSDQPEEGGWRWHKWGDYIGNQKPTCEYIYDEPDIDSVYCFFIYEYIPRAAV